MNWTTTTTRVWKRHRWSMDWEKLECTCTRCGLVVLYQRYRGKARDERVRASSYTFRGIRVAYELPHPKTCEPLPAGMRRVG